MDSTPNIRDLSAAIAGMEGLLLTTTDPGVRTLLKESLSSLRTRLSALAASPAGGGGADAMELASSVVVPPKKRIPFKGLANYTNKKNRVETDKVRSVRVLERAARSQFLGKFKKHGKRRKPKVSSSSSAGASATTPQEQAQRLSCPSSSSSSSSSEGEDEDESEDEDEDGNDALRVTSADLKNESYFAKQEARNATRGSGYHLGRRSRVKLDGPVKKFKKDITLFRNRSVTCQGKRVRNQTPIFNYGVTKGTEHAQQFLSVSTITPQQKVIRELEANADKAKYSMNLAMNNFKESLRAKRVRTANGITNVRLDGVCAERRVAYKAAKSRYNVIIEGLSAAEAVEDKPFQEVLQEHKDCEAEALVEKKNGEAYDIGHCALCRTRCVLVVCAEDDCPVYTCVVCLLKRRVDRDCGFPGHELAMNTYVKICNIAMKHVVEPVAGKGLEIVNAHLLKLEFKPIETSLTVVELFYEIVAQMLWNWFRTPHIRGSKVSMLERVFGAVECFCHEHYDADGDVGVFVGNRPVVYDPDSKAFILENNDGREVVDLCEETDADASDSSSDASGMDLKARALELADIIDDENDAVPRAEAKAALAEVTMLDMDPRTVRQHRMRLLQEEKARVRDDEINEIFQAFLDKKFAEIKTIANRVRALGRDEQKKIGEQLAELEASLGGNAPKLTPAPKPKKAATPALPPMEKEKKKRSACELSHDEPTTSDKKARKEAVAPTKLTAEEKKKFDAEIAALEAALAPEETKTKAKAKAKAKAKK